MLLANGSQNTRSWRRGDRDSQPDTHEDGRGDASDPCTTGGIDASKPSPRGTNFTAATRNDKLKYKAKLVFDGTASISRSDWIPATNGKKFQYITETPVDGLLAKVILKWNPRRPNEVLVNVSGKSGDFADPNVARPLKATISLDPTDAMTSLCADAELPGPKLLAHQRRRPCPDLQIGKASRHGDVCAARETIGMVLLRRRSIRASRLCHHQRFPPFTPPE